MGGQGLERRGAVVAVFVATGMLLGACSGNDGNEEARGRTSPTRQTPEADADTEESPRPLDAFGFTGDFYAVPDPLPDGDPGTLLRAERVADPSVPDGAILLRIMYLSESLAGDPIAVTGLALYPAGDPPPAGRRVLSWAHGTSGIADQCAPSKQPSISTALPFSEPFLQRGWVIVASDYEGLGTPGRHPYIVGGSEGRGVVDAVKAIQDLEDAAASSTFAVWGHSQGGHAALFAGQVAGEWAPDLDLVGVVAGAPATELPLMADALRDNPFQGYLALGAAGMAAAYPDADINQVLTPKAVEMLDIVDQACAGEVLEAFRGLPYEEFSAANPATVEPWSRLLTENNPGTQRFAAPTLIIHGSLDEQVPVLASEVLWRRMCGLGQTVERRVYDGFDHAGVVAASFDDMLIWLEDRFAARPAPSNCPE